MKIGIALPTTIPGVKGSEVTEWARRADATGFSTLRTIDRIVYPNYEPFIGLAAAAAVTERINLTTATAILPYRQNAALVARQAATIHPLSGGRLVLGAAVGGRPDEVRERVRAFAEQDCDELILFPASSNPDQVDKLAAAVP
jgi:alkanesulfonate monooxygenase SsuD/methylene tetrahydromethanopterin reductase-like flavin-dependent oxidoreductase (luciferase family)